MGGKGPPPKPAHLRQRTNKKAGIAVLERPLSVEVPPIPNPDGRTWHPLTVAAWEHAWSSPMATQWLETDIDALGRLALLWDRFYGDPQQSQIMAEIRLQEQRFGFSPLDRSRLQWEIKRAETPEARRRHRVPAEDPRRFLSVS
jgi:hypothetical protein